MAEQPMKATKTKARFEEIFGALLSVSKEETDTIMEAEKKARSKKKHGKKPSGKS